MTDKKSERILKKCGNLVPRLDDRGKDCFLAFLDGVTFMLPPQPLAPTLTSTQPEKK